MQGSRRRRESLALLTSVLIHGLLLSITIAGGGFGLPGLGLPWEKRRAEVPDVTVVLAPAPMPAPTPAPEPGIVPAPVVEAVERKAEVAAPEPAQPPPPAPEQQPVLHTTRPVAAWAVLPRASAPSLTTPLAASSPASELTGLGDGAARELAELERRKREEEQLAEQRRQQQVAAQAAQAAQREAARLEAERKEAAARAEAARLEAERREQARQEALRQEAERTYAAARLAAERLEAARAEAARQELARAEAAAKQEADRLEAARAEAARQESARQEAARAEAARAEAARQEAARQEALAVARAEAARVEAARQEAARIEAAKQEAVRAAAAAREERLKAIGRQLNEEADRRSAGGGNLRRGRLFGRTDANAEMVLYAEAWSRKIELNRTIELMREALAKERYSDPLVTVAVRADGSVESITFVRSSGSPAVDAAVKRVIESQANYPPFHPALAREYDVIEIRRTWHFDSAVRLY